MATRKRRSANRRPSAIETILGAKSLLDKRFVKNEGLQAYLKLEQEYMFLARDYAALKEKLVRILSREQLEASNICGVAPEIYALEWIEIILKEDVRKYTPTFSEHVRNLADIKNGAI